MSEAECLFKVRIPGRAYVKKNTARHFKGRVVYSVKFRAWEKLAHIAIAKAKQDFKVQRAIDFKVHVKITLSYENHLGEPDLSNAIEGAQDALVDMAVIENDRLIYSLDGSRKVFDGAYTDIEIFRFES